MIAEKIFARLLNVDTAYHSHHMLACSSEPYLESLLRHQDQLSEKRFHLDIERARRCGAS